MLNSDYLIKQSLVTNSNCFEKQENKYSDKMPHIKQLSGYSNIEKNILKRAPLRIPMNSQNLSVYESNRIRKLKEFIKLDKKEALLN